MTRAIGLRTSPALEAAGLALTFHAIPRSAFSRLRLFSLASRFDAVVLQRRLLPAYQLWFLRRNARRLTYDFDDALFHRDSYHRKGIVSSERSRQFRRVVRTADAVIAGNEFLKSRAIADGATSSAVRVIPTCVAPAKYPLRGHRAGTSIDLVWIGSSSTLQGIEQKRDLFEALGGTFKNLRLRVICDRFPEFERLPIIRSQWSAGTEAADVASGDIGISWVPDDEWSKGKCGYKILQYYAAGLPVIVNSAAIHPQLVRDGVTGFLADSDQQWIRAIESLSDPRARQRMGSAARDFVSKNYSIAAHQDELVSVLAGRKPDFHPDSDSAGE